MTQLLSLIIAHIKQFLSPKYPADDNYSSPEKIERKKRECAIFEQRQKEIYSSLSAYSDGNNVKITDFFRVGSRYYAVSEKIDSLGWSVEQVAALDEVEKRRLCAIIAHAVASFHNGNIVHSDIKHDNILFAHLPSGRVTAKIIDFDASFLESNPPSAEEGVTGDINYFSPEVCAYSYGESRPLTRKLDVFALGVLFHQYFTGILPLYDCENFSCVGEAVLQKAELKLDSTLAPDIAGLLRKMLSISPEDRPTAYQVFDVLRQYKGTRRATETPPKSNDTADTPASPFYRAGDL